MPEQENELIASVSLPGLKPATTSPGLVSTAGRDLTSIADFTPMEVHALIELGIAMKHQPADFRGVLTGKQLVLFFEKPSLRTRLTFEAGVHSLGGTTFFVDQTGSRLGEREPLKDIAKNLERWVDGVVLRTFSHATVTSMADHASIPVVNALSDHEHPCQALADYMTLAEHLGDASQTKLAYVGDGNNVAHSLMLTAASLGATINVATPEGYEPHASVLSQCAKLAKKTKAKINVINDPVAAVAGVDAIYTDVWASMGQESEADLRRKLFQPYQVNEKLMSFAAPHAKFMHCLPAHRGDEVDAGVIDSSRSIVYDQAENRLHIQKAILVFLLAGGIHRFPPRRAHA
jgi:ornithine carbamoyltransferase